MDEAQRKAARANWPITKVPLTAEQPPDVSALSPSERFGLVWTLTQNAWALSGQPMPSYARSEIPIHFVRGKG